MIGETIAGGTGIGLVITGAAFFGGAAVTLPLVGVAIIGGSVLYGAGNYVCSAYCGENNFFADHAKEYVSKIDRFYFQLPPEVEPINPDLFVDAGPELVLTPEEKAELRDVPKSDNGQVRDGETPGKAPEADEGALREQIRQLTPKQKEDLAEAIRADLDDPRASEVIRQLLEEESEEQELEYSSALIQAEKIASQVIDQVADQIQDPLAAKIAADAAVPIALQISNQITDGTFFNHTESSLKSQIFQHITTEINLQIADPNARSIALQIADSIAGQMATQLLADPELDQIQIKIETLDTEVEDEEVLNTLAKLKDLHATFPKEQLLIWKGNVSGIWSGAFTIESGFECGSVSNGAWEGEFFEGEVDQENELGQTFHGVEGRFEAAGFSEGKIFVGGESTPSVDELSWGSGEKLFWGGKIGNLSGNPDYDKAINGTFTYQCPNRTSIKVAGSFSGKRESSDITGLWSGSYKAESPAQCLDYQSGFDLQITEKENNITGLMYASGNKIFEVLGFYEPERNRAVMSAGDFSFVAGVGARSSMSGKFIGPTCGGAYVTNPDAEPNPEDNQLKGSFQTDFVRR